eukprot:gnl/TRDRNA2_/TRDRNA2_176286_c3_seq4.p1 gnl/TRDRNA2_/TRDRNA2_176286_c3~~gnl/TRDRNA2_/TRDRNA2_176286_c3_seq4.p1  ORF type:complete len:489 (+),score=21.14 gnl/TRDRNA2_/TRDRNA2_176286_c3_seq4:74-1468(+)
MMPTCSFSYWTTITALWFLTGEIAHGSNVFERKTASGAQQCIQIAQQQDTSWVGTGTTCNMNSNDQVSTHFPGQPNRVDGFGPLKIGTKCMAAHGTGWTGSGAADTAGVRFEDCVCLDNPNSCTGEYDNGQCACALGYQLWKPIGTADAQGFQTWRVQRKNNNLGIVTTSNHVSSLTHCLKHSSGQNQLVIQQNCGTGDSSHLFKLTGSLTQSVNNDPEVVNIKGEHFEVRDKGGITLLHVPREEPISRAVLVLVGEIQPLPGSNNSVAEALRRWKHKPCIQTYVRNLLITGTVLGELTALTFHARNNTAPFLMGFGNQLIWLPDGKITDASISAYFKLLPIHTNVSVTTSADKPGYPNAIYIKMGTVILTLRRPHVPEGMHWEFINLELTGLDTLPYPFESIGGVLGTDSPIGASRKPKWHCVSVSKKLHIPKEHVVSLAEGPVSALVQEVSINGDADFEEDI